eukprot:7613597-Ditylum_brightwellii.AAC.1
MTYFNKEYHHGQDIDKVLEIMAPYQIPIPTVLTRITDTDLQLEFKKQMVSNFLKREPAYEEDLCKAYVLVWGQCTDFIQSHIKSYPSYKTINNSRDVVELLKAIKGTTFYFEEEQYLELALLE